MMFAGSLPVANAQHADDAERLLKAVFIYNFAKFTRWPEKSGEAEGNSLKMCTVGNDELVDALVQLGGKVIKGRPVTILSIDETQCPGCCHLLYIANSERERRMDLISSVRGEPVLTISETPGFVNAGGIIELYHEQGRVRFIINLAAARSAGLEFSSRLLNLAVVVNREEAP